MPPRPPGGPAPPGSNPLPKDYVWLTVRAMFGRASNDSTHRVKDLFIAHGLTPELRFADIKGPRLIVVSSDLNTGQPVLHGESPDDNVLEALSLSTALPPWFLPVKKQGRYLMDGGVVSNLPIEAALRFGATEIVALDLIDMRDVLLGGGEGIGGFLDKLILAVEKRQSDLELQLARARGIPLVYLELVSETLVPMWDFQHTKELIAQGYAIARRVMDGRD
jgi:predicted acylesterase/phospholipase RssA